MDELKKLAAWLEESAEKDLHYDADEIYDEITNRIEALETHSKVNNTRIWEQ